MCNDFFIGFFFKLFKAFVTALFDIALLLLISNDVSIGLDLIFIIEVKKRRTI